MNRGIAIIAIVVAAVCTNASGQKRGAPSEEKSVINLNDDGKGPEIIIEFNRGKSFNYPLMAAWIEDAAGNYIQTLFVPVSVASGIFKYGRMENNKWISAPKRAPQALPYWAHKRGVKASDGLYMPEPDNPIADAYTGATPVRSFIIKAKADQDLPDLFRVMFEINQNWDWNEYWTNNRFPDDENYKMSCQPALVYEATIDINKMKELYVMEPVGHSHYSGKTGELFTDLSTITTALNIADSIIVRVNFSGR